VLTSTTDVLQTKKKNEVDAMKAEKKRELKRRELVWGKK